MKRKLLGIILVVVGVLLAPFALDPMLGLTGIRVLLAGPVLGLDIAFLLVRNRQEA